MTPLVVVLCQHCSTRLGSLDTMPDDWSGRLRVDRCPKCVVPEPRRVVEVLAQQRAAGFAMKQTIPLADLRPHAMKAKRRGRPVNVRVPPFGAAQF